MDGYYILRGKEAVPATPKESMEQRRESIQRVGNTKAGDATVSTVFLGLDHRYGDGPPQLFETLVFGGPFDGWMDRCATWEQAEAMHEKAVAFCKAGVGP